MRLNPKFIGAGLFVIVVGALVWSIFFRGGEPASAPRQATASSATPSPSGPSQTRTPSTPAAPSPTPTGDQDVTKLLRGFVTSYYSVKAEWFPGGKIDQAADAYRTAVRPYVTDEFLDEYLPPLDLPANQFVINQEGSIIARLKSVEPRGLSDGMVLQVVVTADRVFTDKRRDTLGEFPYRVQLVKQDDAWKVSAAEH